ATSHEELAPALDPDVIVHCDFGRLIVERRKCEDAKRPPRSADPPKRALAMPTTPDASASRGIIAHPISSSAPQHPSRPRLEATLPHPQLPPRSESSRPRRFRALASLRLAAAEASLAARSAAPRLASSAGATAPSGCAKRAHRWSPFDSG